MMSDKLLRVTSTAFENNGKIPSEFTGYGADYSPALTLDCIDLRAESIAIIMVDLDIPFIREYPHWLIWNLPVQTNIPVAIPQGESLPALDGAKQGLAYGKHVYRGPKPPVFIRKAHRYVFTVYVLDVLLALDSDAKRKDLLQAMAGHILQQGSITGLYSNKQA